MKNSRLQELSIKVDRAKASVKRAKLRLKKASLEDTPMAKRTLKAARTKLKNAEDKYLAEVKSVLNDKKNKVSDSVASKFKKIPFKGILTWTGLAVTTVVTAIGGFMLYDYLSTEEQAKTDQV